MSKSLQYGISMVVGLGLLLLRATEQTGDSLAYSLEVEGGYDLLHPHHLLFEPTVRGLLLVLRLFDQHADAILAGQILNIGLGVATLWIVFRIFRNLLLSPSGAGIVTLLLLFSHYFWVYMTQVEVYIPALFLSSWLFLLLSEKEAVMRSPGRCRLMVGVWTLSTLYYQANLLFGLALACLALCTRTAEVRKLVTRTLLWGIALIGGTYYLLFLIATRDGSIGGFLAFCLSYASHPNPEWGNLAHFSPQGLLALVQSLLWSLLRTPASFKTPLALALGATVIAAILWNLRQIWRGGPNRDARILATAWYLVYSGFFLWWLPAESQFSLLILTPLFVLLSTGFQELGGKVRETRVPPRVVRTALLLLVSLVGAFHLLKVVVPMHRSRGPNYDEAVKLATVAGETCWIASDYHVLQNLRYHLRFDRAYELQISLLEAYLDGEPDALHEENGSACLVLRLDYLVPSYRISGYDGYSNPQGWMRFLASTLGFVYDLDGRLVACRRTVMEADDRGVLVSVLPDTIPATGLEPVLRRLDRDVRRVTASDASPFGSWYSTVWNRGRQP